MIELRRARPEEAPVLLGIVEEGYETYREFAPPGWEPPDERELEDRMRSDLAHPAALALVAEDGGKLLGFTFWVPPELTNRPQPVPPNAPAGGRARPFSAFPELPPGFVHLRHLFVRREHWGRGVARSLHREAVAEMRRRGAAGARLYTPAEQARARRFYEREGWQQHGEPFYEQRIAFEIVEYRLALG